MVENLCKIVFLSNNKPNQKYGSAYKKVLVLFWSGSPSLKKHETLTSGSNEKDVGDSKNLDYRILTIKTSERKIKNRDFELQKIVQNCNKLCIIS